MGLSRRLDPTCPVNDEGYGPVQTPSSSSCRGRGEGQSMGIGSYPTLPTCIPPSHSRVTSTDAHFFMEVLCRWLSVCLCPQVTR